MAVLTEGAYLGDVLKFELPNLYSREKLTVLAGSGSARSLTVGMVVGISVSGTAGTPTAAGAGAAGANTGTGTMTMDGTTPLLPGAQYGTYTARCTAAASNSGTFRVFDPKGNVLGDVAVGATFANQIKFAIADGVSADFIVGDAFTVAVALTPGKVVQLDFAATNGTQVAAGIVAADVTAAASVDALGTFIVRGAIVEESALVWPTGATAAQKALATAQLGATFPPILVRKGA
jgi:hypothetical protein